VVKGGVEDDAEVADSVLPVVLGFYFSSAVKIMSSLKLT